MILRCLRHSSILSFLQDNASFVKDIYTFGMQKGLNEVDIDDGQNYNVQSIEDN